MVQGKERCVSSLCNFCVSEKDTLHIELVKFHGCEKLEEIDKPIDSMYKYPQALRKNNTTGKIDDDIDLQNVRFSGRYLGNFRVFLVAYKSYHGHDLPMLSAFSEQDQARKLVHTQLLQRFANL